MPLADQGALLTPQHSTPRCPNTTTIRQVLQGAAIPHPKQMNCGVHGALKMVAHIGIQRPTALCCRTPTPRTSGRSYTNTRCAIRALSKATTGNIAPPTPKNAAPSAAILIIQFCNVCPQNNLQPTQAPADGLALNVSLAFRDTRYSHIRLAARAPYYSAIPNLNTPSKD